MDLTGNASGRTQYDVAAFLESIFESEGKCKIIKCVSSSPATVTALPTLLIWKRLPPIILARLGCTAGRSGSTARWKNMHALMAFILRCTCRIMLSMAGAPRWSVMTKCWRPAMAWWHFGMAGLSAGSFSVIRNTS